jgi:repressor LexA
VAEHFGLAQNAAYQIIGYLKKKRYLIDSGGHRGLRLSQAYIETQKRAAGIPIVGAVAAGAPILAEENIEGYVNLNELLGPADGRFILKVVGDSMVDEGIFEGDFVVVEPGERLRDGQIGVVLLNDEATVKRIRIRRGRTALEPANKTARYKTRYIKKVDENVRIVGRVTGCFRML